MRKAEKTIITCAITGAIHMPCMSPYLPVTPAQIADEAVAAAEAGAAIIHLHARDPETGMLEEQERHEDGDVDRRRRRQEETGHVRRRHLLSLRANG